MTLAQPVLKVGVAGVGVMGRNHARVLAQFRDDHPGVEIRLQVCNNRDEVVALMQRAATDAAKALLNQYDK